MTPREKFLLFLQGYLAMFVESPARCLTFMQEARGLADWDWTDERDPPEQMAWEYAVWAAGLQRKPDWAKPVRLPNGEIYGA